jgi:murein DD-endopeptidase MepM/ murein hydrolase activator NlpD
MRTPRADERRSHRRTGRRPVALGRTKFCVSFRTSSRVVAAALFTVLLGFSLSLSPVGVSAQTSEDEAERAAREIQDARDRANAAAQAFLDAQSELETLGDEVVQLELEAEQLETTVEGLRSKVESVALARFIGTGSSGIPLLTGIQDPQEQVQAAVFVDLLTNTGNDALDQYDEAQKELAENQDELADRRDDVENQQQVFAQLQADSEAEVERLREVEAQRLNDEAVRKALAAKLAAERARAEEAARAAAEAAAQEVPNPGAAAVDDSATPDAPAGGSDADSGPSDAGSGSSDSTPTATTPPAPPVNAGSSGGTSGGRTGVSGGGSTPAPIPAAPVIVGGLACPMPGSAYGDTFGASRSGGRRHEGVDMLAPRGTPIYAVTGGYAAFKQTRLGGNSVSLAGDDGTRYFYAHLSGFEGPSRRVAQGEVIGYNGDTGNASGVPHLHFEVHPGGGSAINPTPTVRAAGC